MINQNMSLCILMYLAFLRMYKGESCDNNCNAACTAVDGGCSTTCKPGYYGRKCQYPIQCLNGRGLDYQGTKNTTENNRQCQAWSSRVPNNHGYMLPASYENYCRNPTGRDPKPWCYNALSDNPRFELCDIPRCDDQCPVPKFELFGEIENPPDAGFYIGVVVRILTGCGPGSLGEQECLSSKTWSSGRNCRKILWCPKPTITIPNANIAPSEDDYYYDDTVNFTCNTGYESDGGYIIRCRADKTWSSLPKCNRVQCSLPSLSSNSIIQRSKNEYRYLDVIEIGCMFGYNIVGQKSLVCRHDKTWSPTVPSCAPVSCPLPSLAEGMIILNSTKQFVFKESVKVGCEQGYTLSGSPAFTCNGNGSWSGVFPTCLPLPCDIPLLPEGMSFIKFENKTYVHRDKLTIECKYTGLETELSCLADQTWGIIPNCTEVERGTITPTTEPSVLPAVLGGLFGAVVVVNLVVVVIFIIRRQKRAREKQQEPPSTLIDERVGTYTDLIMGDIETQVSVYDTIAPMYTNVEMADSSTKFKLQNAVSYVYRKKNGTCFKEQIKGLISGPQRPTTEASKDANKVKNRHANIHPYDDNRVVLTVQNNDTNSSYINASYIKNVEDCTKYIAAQGPMSATVVDFWRMVWEQDVEKIVMLTNVETGLQYWPNAEMISVTYGNLTISLRIEDVYSEFIIRHLLVSKVGSNSRRIVLFQFTSWREQSVPKYASSFAEFRRKVVGTARTSKGPLIVQCSNGIGRTGTFIALDIIMENAKVSGEVDVVECVQHLREQRMNMVQTEEQFLFLHDVLIEEHECDIFDMATSNFQNKYRELLDINPRTRKPNLEQVYDLLRKTSPILREDNYENLDPVFNKRIHHDDNMFRGDATKIEGSNDLKATYLPRYRDEHAFIVTQMPLMSTVTDFLDLVLERKVTCVVMLNESVKACGVYWPQTDDFIRFGCSCSVQVLEESTMGTIQISKLKINNGKKTHIFTQIRVLNWSDKQDIPEDPTLFLRIMEYVDLLQRREPRQPVIVHCMDGWDKSGLLCCAIGIIDRLKSEGSVVIQHVIKQMKSRHRQIIKNLAQFDFCFKMISTFLKENE